MIDIDKDLAMRNSAGLVSPLRVPSFRSLLIADFVSDVGTFMQNVGAAWLMVSLHAGPGYVALIQTAASLPYFLLALPAGSAGDIFDRRRLILFTEAWMMGVALILAVLTIRGSMGQYAGVRRRDGAYKWGIYRDIEMPNRFVKIFLVQSWAEHLHQHERQTKADRELEQQVYSYVAGDPTVRHLHYAYSKKL